MRFSSRTCLVKRLRSLLALLRERERETAMRYPASGVQLHLSHVSIEGYVTNNYIESVTICLAVACMPSAPLENEKEKTSESLFVYALCVIAFSRALQLRLCLFEGKYFASS